MRKIKIIDGNYKKDGLRIYDNCCPTLSARDYKEPKMVYEEIQNNIQQRNDTAIRGGGKYSLTPKHCWDLIIEEMIEIKSNTKKGFEEAKEGDTINFSVPNSKTRRGRVGVGVAQTLDTQVNQGVVIAQRGRGESGNTTQQLEARNDGNTNTLTGVQKDNMVINTPNHGRAKGIYYTEESPTLQSQMGTGGDNIPYVNNIRRLTEIECERLQGFPDNWTKVGNYDGVVKDISKSQRYKMCGNAVTKTVVEMIAIKLLNNL